MKAIISSTYDDKYLFFLPIVTFCCNKLGVDVICFLPFTEEKKDYKKLLVCQKAMWDKKMNYSLNEFFSPEHKEATYAQCSRLYAACLDLPEDEVIITSDVDMAMFKLPTYISGFTIFGSDLVPDNQYPMCYISASVKDWRRVFNLRYFTYQQCLDGVLGEIEAEHFRGNYWGKDQEEAYQRISSASALVNVQLVPRSNGQNQFATKRYDRDDVYILDRLNPDTIDFHMNRPGYEEKNFEIILTILKYHYPNEDFGWLKDFRNEYLKLL